MTATLWWVMKFLKLPVENRPSLSSRRVSRPNLSRPKGKYRSCPCTIWTTLRKQINLKACSIPPDRSGAKVLRHHRLYHRVYQSFSNRHLINSCSRNKRSIRFLRDRVSSEWWIPTWWVSASLWQIEPLREQVSSILLTSNFQVRPSRIVVTRSREP